MALPASQLEGRSAELESLVQEVLRRLAAIASAPSDDGAAGGGASNAGAGAARAGQDAKPPAADTARLAIRERVVTMAVLRDRLSGVRQVVVHPRAIVTPLVRDELKQRRIELLR
ncbi:MAG: hypothetical protein J5I93_18340, partial [Pirellulaceae bacterium]|nr:hypothetical protein [Pirellulaceae bacterium]